MPKRTFWLLVTLLGLGAALHITVHCAPFEDAYITYRYAENFAGGRGLVYNPGQRVEGFSSFSFTLLLGVLAWLGLPLEPISRVLSIAAGLVLLWLCVRLASLYIERERPSGWHLVPALLVAANGSFAYYAGSGMETTGFVLLLHWAILVLLKVETASRALGAGLLLGAAAMTRPEGLGYALLVLLAGSVGSDSKFGSRVWLGFAGVFLPFFVGRWLYFGYPAPNTYYAKASPSWALFGNGLVYAEAFLSSRLFWLALASAAVLGVLRRRQRRYRVMAAVVLGSLGNVIVVGGDTFAYYRFFLPALPLGWIAFVTLVEARTRTLALTWRRTAMGLLLILAGYGCLAQALPTRSLTTVRSESEYERVARVARINQDYFAVGSWLRQHMPPETLLAVNAAGIVPYVSGLPTLDMLGLNDLHIAHRSIELGRGAMGHEKHDAAYVLAKKPDIILLGLPRLLSTPPRREQLGHVVSRYFPYLPGDRELFESPAFRRDYAVRLVPLESGVLLMFVRKPGQGVPTRGQRH